MSTSGLKSRVQGARQRLRSQLEECCAIARDRRGQSADEQHRPDQECPCDGCEYAPRVNSSSLPPAAVALLRSTASATSGVVNVSQFLSNDALSPSFTTTKGGITLHPQQGGSRRRGVAARQQSASVCAGLRTNEGDAQDCGEQCVIDRDRPQEHADHLPPRADCGEVHRDQQRVDQHPQRGASRAVHRPAGHSKGNESDASDSSCSDAGADKVQAKEEPRNGGWQRQKSDARQRFRRGGKGKDSLHKDLLDGCVTALLMARAEAAT